MPREIWNEGRVVGLSTYEIYVREFLSQNPTGTPASEREWLASSIASGASMLLKFPTVTPAPNTTDTAVTIPLPADSNLCAANNIVASFFHGDAVVDSSGYWAEYVTDYGELISNTASSSPTNPMTPQGDNTVPTAASLEWSGTAKTQLANYLKIVDGIVIQPGTWSTASSNPPQKDLAPNLDRVPSVRFHVHGTIDTQFWILLTGFTVRGVLDGISGVDGSVGTDAPADGDFLGPAVFPWASKIIFALPVGAASSLLSGSYTRQVTPTSAAGQSLSVTDTPIVDLRYSSNFYSSNFQSSPINYTVSDLDFSGDGVSVLAVFPRSMNGPRGLYGSRVTSPGSAVFEPIDCHAPGTAKLLELGSTTDAADCAAALQRMKDTPNTSLLLADTDSDNELYMYTYVLDGNNDPVRVPVAHSSITKSSTAWPGYYKYIANVATGLKSPIQVIALVDESGNVLPTTGTTRSFDLQSVAVGDSVGDLNWDVLLAALGNDGRINVLGNRLKQLRSQLENNFVAGKQYALVNRSNSVVLEEVAALPNFFCETLACIPCWYDSNGVRQTGSTAGSGNIYSQVMFNIFGYASAVSQQAGIINTFGTLTCTIGSHSNVGQGNNWFQQFYIADTSANSPLQRLIDKLALNNDPAWNGDSVVNNTLKVVTSPITPYVNSGTNFGAPKSDAYNRFQAYINTITPSGSPSGVNSNVLGNKGEGIIYALNGGGTAFASSISMLCSVGIYSSSSPYPAIRRRSDGSLQWS